MANGEPNNYFTFDLSDICACKRCSCCGKVIPQQYQQQYIVPSPFMAPSVPAYPQPLPYITVTDTTNLPGVKLPEQK
jgi:hypothetical protein